MSEPDVEPADDGLEPADDDLEPDEAQAAGGPPARRSKPRTYHDWPAVKARYVEGVKTAEGHDWPSLTAVAEHFGMWPSSVRTQAAKEGWRAQRTQYQAQVEATRRQARAAALSTKATNLDNSALSGAQLGIQLSLHRLKEIGDRRLAEPVDALELQRHAQAVDLWHKIGLRAIGDPETHRVELTGANGAPLEIAAELRRDDADRLTGVLAVLQQAGVGDLFTRESAERIIDLEDSEVTEE